MTASPSIAGRGLSLHRGERRILRDVDVEARPGEVLGILGPSGAGKSSLFRVLAGEIRADSGQVLLGTVDVTSWPLWKRARARLGYMPQSPSVLWDLTIAANLSTFARIAGVEDDEQHMRERAERVGLASRLSVRAGDLSGGERRRLEFARAVMHAPTVLICDEPFAGIDPGGAEQLGALLQDLAARDVAVILADHHVEEALRICTRAVLLLDGSVAVSGTPDEFKNDPLVQGRYLGSWSRSLPPRSG